jgi:hypothetical protein
MWPFYFFESNVTNMKPYYAQVSGSLSQTTYYPMPQTKRSYLVGILGVIAIVLQAACGGGGSSGNDSTNFVPLTITASIDANTSSPLTGQEIKFLPNVLLNGSVPAGATLTQVRWDFGDGSPVVTVSNAASFTTAQFKSYAGVGSFIVTLGATASTGESGSITRTISVQSSAPTGTLSNAITVANIGDYTRLGSDGRSLPIQTATWNATGNNADGTRWECVKDNQSGLIWEVKSTHDASALRHYTATFTWFNSDSSTNGGSAGTEIDGNAAVCNGVSDLSKCNTQAYKTAVRALPTGQALCGFRDWRMPSLDELISIRLFGVGSPAINSASFPDINLNVLNGGVWSSSSVVDLSYLLNNARFVAFSGGIGDSTDKYNAKAVRLVRSGQ